MNIQINTGHNIQSNETLIANFRRVIESSLSQKSNHVTKVEVHLKDEDGAKKGKNDKRCMIEARLEGRQPIVVIDHGATVNQALDGAIDKLLNMIESILGRQNDRRLSKTKQSAHEMKFPEM